MLRPSATQLLKENQSYYSLVVGIAKRAREIADEIVENKEILEQKPVKMAVDEYEAGKFNIIEIGENTNK